MRIGKHSFLKIIMCTAACLLTGCGSETDASQTKTSEEIEGVFSYYNRMLEWDGEEDSPALETSGATSFDIRELAEQVDGFWEYYENYEKELAKLRTAVEGWEADFIPEGVYEVGVDLEPGYYVLCNPELELAPGERIGYGAEGDDLENGIRWQPDADTLLGNYYYDAFFEIGPYYDEGDVISVKGHPKFAPLKDFPALSPAEDGNYYGFETLYFYEVGKDIPAGEYFVLSMNISTGELDYLGGRGSWAENTLYARNRFAYVTLKEGSVFSMDKCVLIPIEHKPDILPITHEDISYRNEEPTLAEVVWENYFPQKKSGETYEIPVYAEGEYIIGEDIPLGTYRIQNEIAFTVNDVEETAPHSNFYQLFDYSWTGLRLLDIREKGDAGWSFIRTGLYGEYVQIGKTDSTSEYMQTDKGGLPEVIFDESDSGYVVRIVRCLLIPKQN